MTCTDLVTYRRPRIFGETFIVVARFTEGSYYHDDPEGKPDADVWIVKAGRGSMAREKTGKSWHVWIKPDFYKSKKQYNSPFLDWIGRFDRAHSKIGFCEGKPMTSMHHEIPICWNHEIPCKLVSYKVTYLTAWTLPSLTYLPTFRYFHDGKVFWKKLVATAPLQKLRPAEMKPRDPPS